MFCGAMPKINNRKQYKKHLYYWIFWLENWGVITITLSYNITYPTQKNKSVYERFYFFGDELSVSKFRLSQRW